MNIMTKRGAIDNIVTYEHYCDTKEDLLNIPREESTLGSIAIVINDEDGELNAYIANTKRQWVPLLDSVTSGDEFVGISYYICSNDDITSAGIPNIEEPDDTTFYLVPDTNPNTNNLYEEWIYVNNNWEKFGSGGATLIETSPDWNEASSASAAFIFNKPNITAGTNNGIQEGNNAISTGNYAHAEGNGTLSSGNNSHAEGASTKALGVQSHAEGSSSTASGSASHAEGYRTTASGIDSHAEGGNTQATGSYSHAEGSSTISSGYGSHAEGANTQALAEESHAEGSETKAAGKGTHAEGGNTQALGRYSHAQGYNTIASHYCQTVVGKYNIVDPSTAAANLKGTYVEIVGTGDNNDTRRNGRTLDWDGNEWLAGGLTVGSGITIGSTELSEQALQELLSFTSASGVSF